MKTILVNAFGGPGSGKTTAAWEICAELKKAGILAEYVSEYAKELVYEMNSPLKAEAERAKELLNGTMSSQSILFAEQKHRIDRLMGQVAVIVTDSPIMLSAIYAKDRTQEFEDNIIRQFFEYNGFNFVISRDDSAFEAAGRLQNFQEAKQKDQEILNMLNRYGIPYEQYTHETLGRLILRIKELSRAFENAETLTDMQQLQDHLSGVMLRSDNAKSLVRSLNDQQLELNDQIEELQTLESEREE